jgi:hypothetical protein
MESQVGASTDVSLRGRGQETGVAVCRGAVVGVAGGGRRYQLLSVNAVNMIRNSHGVGTKLDNCIR